jgi:hypothetical protein
MTEAISRRTAVKLAILTMVATLGIAVPVSVWANHQFNDVPTGHPFHKDISAVAEAGITTGFPDGGFHPSDPVTRQAMAAFLERGLGRVGASATTQAMALTPNGETRLTVLWLDAGATGTGSGLVRLTGTASLHASTGSQCPCLVRLDLADEAGNVVGSSQVDIDSAENEQSSATTHATVQGVAPLAGNATGRFTLKAHLSDTATSVTADATLIAEYVPFGPDGDDTSHYCSTQEDEPNGTMAQATALGGDIDVSLGCIEPALDVDWFTMSLPGGFNVYAATYGLGGLGTCDVDTLVQITDNLGSVIASDDDSGDGRCSFASASSGSGGTFFFRVTSFSGLKSGSYWLEAGFF